MNRTWQPATIADEAVTARNKRREELASNAGPIDYTLTPKERDIAALAMVEVMAGVRKANRSTFQDFTPGLLVKELTINDLTPAERKAFGLEPQA